MAENKTQPTTVTVDEFVASVEHPGRRADSFGLLELMGSITGQEAVMWDRASLVSAITTTGTPVDGKAMPLPWAFLRARPTSPSTD